MSNLDTILSPQYVRKSCQEVYSEALKGKTHFKIHEDKISSCTDYVMEVIRSNYPDLNIPFHSRWGHFQVGKIDRLTSLFKSLENLSPIDQAKEKWDLVIPSVLLDAGAGMGWKFFDSEHKQYFSKSEGLALASLEMYKAGRFKDGSTLKNVTPDSIKKYFQVEACNPLIGIEGRALLLQSLGNHLINNKKNFPNSRVSDLIDHLLKINAQEISAVDVLKTVLKNLGAIWPGRIQMDGVNLGDVWEYAPLKTKVAFHKLSQWLTYSLLTPLMDAGIKIKDVNLLTGLPEYRNGGLFLDYGVLELKDKTLTSAEHLANSELVVEWRALTVCLLDKVGALVQQKLNKSPEDFPLAKVLEGGTWWAGRKIALSLRSDGGPPLKLKSDGTVF